MSMPAYSEEGDPGYESGRFERFTGLSLAFKSAMAHRSQLRILPGTA